MLVIFSLFLTGCVAAMVASAVYSVDSKSELNVESEYRQQAIEYADKYAIRDYKFLDIELFKPLTNSNFKKWKRNNGLLMYKTDREHGLFDNRFVGLNENGLVVSIAGTKILSDKSNAQIFMKKIHDALQPKFPFMRESNESEMDYTVVFYPRENYIDRYVSHEENSGYSTKSMQFGYKSSYYYSGNIMADDNLSFIFLDATKVKTSYVVSFQIRSVEADELLATNDKKTAAKISDEIFTAYNPKKVRKEKGFNIGTGFYINSNGYLLTNFHVIAGANHVYILDNNKNKMEVKIIGVSAENDIAILKANTKSIPIPMSSSQLAVKGTEVMAIGYPLIQIQGQEQKVTFGRINSLSGIGDDSRYFQVDVPIQLGNSGGPLITKRGRVAGIVTATLNQVATLKVTGTIPQNVNYAIKINAAISLLTAKNVNFQRVGVKQTTFIDLIRKYESSVVLVISK